MPQPGVLRAAPTSGASAVAEDYRELQAAVERHRDALEGRVGLPGARIDAERVLVRENVVGDDDRPGLQLPASDLEQLLVLLLLGVEEDDVEDVVDRGKGLRSEEHTSELQSRVDLVCRLLLEKK